MPIYLSKSRLEDYLNCGRLYQGRHVLKRGGPTKWELARGGIVHQTIQAYHAEPTARLKEKLSLDIALALFAGKEKDIKFESDEERDKAKAQIVACVTAYAQNPLPDPTGWEVKFPSLTRGPDIVVNGRWDLVYANYPAEIKVTSKLPGGKSGENQDEITAWANEKIDGPLYAWAWKETYGTWPEKIVYYVLGLFDNKKEGIYALGRVIEWPVQPAMVQIIYDNLEMARIGIEAGSFPAHWGSWLCDKCEFRAVCLKKKKWTDLPMKPDFKSLMEDEAKKYQEALATARRAQIPQGGKP